NGNKVAGAPVAWSMSPDAGAKFSPATCSTDANGKCSADITAPTTSGAYDVYASVTQNGAVIATGHTGLQVKPGPVGQLAVDLAPQSIPADGKSFVTTTATALDQYGNLVPNAPIAWTTSGDSTFVPPSCMTTTD